MLESIPKWSKETKKMKKDYRNYLIYIERKYKYTKSKEDRIVNS